MGVLKVKVNGAWEDVSGVTTHEVVVSDTDPRQGVYTNAVIWFDTTLPVGERMKVWDPDTSAWVTAEGGSDGDFLPLTGGTLTGNLTLTGTNHGVHLSEGTAIYDRSGTGFVIGSNGQPKFQSPDGSNVRDVIDTTNGDARYLRTAAATTHNVSWNTGWSGTCQYRVNPLMVTCHMVDVGYNADTVEPWFFLMHYYPAGVPAPWANLRVPVSFVDASNSSWWNMGEVQFNTDGVYIKVWDNRRLGNAESFSCTVSWAR